MGCRAVHIDGLVSGLNAEVPLFEEFPFHPDLLLQEYASIFHPATPPHPLRYFRKAR